MWTDGRTDGWTDIFPLYTIRSTFGSQPNNYKTLQNVILSHIKLTRHCTAAQVTLTHSNACQKLKFGLNFGFKLSFEVSIWF